MERNWREEIAERNAEALFIGDPEDRKFDEAIVGIGSRCGQPDLLVYSYEKIIDVLVKDGMEREEATEYADFNIVGAWVGEHTPIILT
jgi:hypothetical protein